MTLTDFEATFLTSVGVNWPAVAELSDTDALAVAIRLRRLGHEFEAKQVETDVSRREMKQSA